MFSASVIDPRTVHAYLETEYRVHGEPGRTFRVGQASADLLSAHKRQKVDCSAFLTACNPFSEPFDAAANAARQAALAKELSRRSLVFLPGIGPHPSNKWHDEDSFLVFGLTLEAAKVIGSVIRRMVTVEWTKKDKYGRVVGRVKADGEDVCLDQVRSGFAWHYKQYATEQPAGQPNAYAAAEEGARQEKAGLWSQPNPVPPWEFRQPERSGPRK